MPSQVIEQLASDFFQLMPLFRKNIFKSFDKMVKDALSPMQLHVLLFLKDREPRSMSELAAEMNVLKQQLTFLTDKLAENGFIERVHDKKDRRSVKISITQKGIDFLADRYKQMLGLVISKFEELSEEDIKELHAAVQSIHKIMERL